jgi:TIR domain
VIAFKSNLQKGQCHFMPEVPRKPIEVFYSYTRKDERLQSQLDAHLSLLKHEGIINIWHKREISAGAEWRQEVDTHINSAQIILLLVTPDFLASDYAYGAEMTRAMERHERGEASVIPIILRPVDWQGAPFAKLQVLPRDGKPVTTWADRDEAFVDIARSIRLICEELIAADAPLIEIIQDSTVPDQQIQLVYKLREVFVKSGVPGVTFVERDDFRLLKLSLDDPIRCVVIEGPSGIGKTTALRRAIKELGLQKTGETLTMLTARDLEDRNKLQTLPHWYHDIVIIDDFHRLDTVLRKEIVDLLKKFADNEQEVEQCSSAKLVIVGIPQTSQTLVDTSFDVEGRFDVFKLGPVKKELIIRMIEAGEKALNIIFDRKADITLAASGSLNIAQHLCYNICAWEGVTETQKNLRIVHCDIDTEVDRVMTNLARKFGETIRRFVAMGGYRDSTCLELLKELADSDEGALSLPILKAIKPELARGIERFINNEWMKKLYSEYPESKNYLFFNPTTHALIIDDPQLIFYLKKISFPVLAKEVGKVAARTGGKVFISYSHKDANWLERLQVHLTPIVREGLIDLWDDTKIIGGSNWRAEIQKAIESSTVAVILISADFMASEFISEYELPQLLSRAESGGTTILPVIAAPSLFIGSGLDVFQAINSPSKPLISMTVSEQEEALVKLATTIRNKLLAENR